MSLIQPRKLQGLVMFHYVKNLTLGQGRILAVYDKVTHPIWPLKMRLCRVSVKMCFETNNNIILVSWCTHTRLIYILTLLGIRRIKINESSNFAKKKIKKNETDRN